MVKKELNTEERIKEAARKVFMRKGFKGATSREIANEAGLNVALANYYFRKKEKLFQIVFRETVGNFLNDIINTLNEPIDLKAKIRSIIECEYQIQIKNPDLFTFLYSEIRINAVEYLKELSGKKDQFLKAWSKQINENIENNKIRNIDPISALTITMSHMHFPIIAASFLKKLGNFNDNAYNKFLFQQKEYAIEMVTKFLFLE